MIDFFQAIVLGLVQGLTEFLPVSSSAHLILVPKLSDWPDQGLAFDVAVHFGTLFAVITYFRKDIYEILQKAFNSLSQGTEPLTKTLAWKLSIATLPAVFFGLLFHEYISTEMRSVYIIVATTILYGLLLGIAAYFNQPRIVSLNLNMKQVLFIGFAQALALIPGTSRSGITLTAGLFLGLSKETAAKFSFLLAIPTISLACIYEFYKLIREPTPYTGPVLVVGCLVSMLSAYICIHFFLKWINHMSLIPFVVYRVILGCFLLFLF